MKQIVCDTIKRYVKMDLESNGYSGCRWKTEPLNGREYCHFLTDVGCGFWNPEYDIIEKPCRDKFYPCDLPQMRLKLLENGMF